MEATSDISAQADTVVRPVRDVDAEALGRVHAACWNETYDHLISKAALENVSPKRLAELWTHWAAQGPEFKMFAALADGEIVGFVGSGPARDRDVDFSGADHARGVADGLDAGRAGGDGGAEHEAGALAQAGGQHAEQGRRV